MYPSALNKNRLINKAFSKYGYTNFELLIYSLENLDNCELVNREAARVLEQYYILILNSAYNEIKVAGTGKEFTIEAKLAHSKKLSKPVFVYKQTKPNLESILIYISESFTKLSKELGISRSTITKAVSNNNYFIYGQLKLSTILDNSVERNLVAADKLKEHMAKLRAKNRINNLKNYGKGKNVIITNIADNTQYNAPSITSAVSYLNKLGIKISISKLSSILINSNCEPYTFKEGFRIEGRPD